MPVKERKAAAVTIQKVLTQSAITILFKQLPLKKTVCKPA